MSRGKPLSFDRNEALQKAMELFWRKGYEATGLTELLKHMGIQRQSFYNTFGNKEEILFEAIDLYGTNVRSMLRESIAKGETPFEKIDAVFGFWSQENPFGCFIGNSYQMSITLTGLQKRWKNSSKPFAAFLFHSLRKPLNAETYRRIEIRWLWREPCWPTGRALDWWLKPRSTGKSCWAWLKSWRALWNSNFFYPLFDWSVQLYN